MGTSTMEVIADNECIQNRLLYLGYVYFRCIYFEVFYYGCIHSEYFYYGIEVITICGILRLP
jgi:hypothetical protein